MQRLHYRLQGRLPERRALPATRAPVLASTLLLLGLVLSTAEAALASPPASVETATPLSEEAALLKESLKLSVIERGPRHPWRIVLENRGPKPIRFASDARLLWFTVQVPGRKEPVSCMLPEAMRPSASSLKKRWSRGRSILAPGERFVRRIDPRFYCFEEGEQTVLVPGALVRASLGWPDETKTTWKKGKRVVEILPPSPPFVATLAPSRSPQLADDPDPDFLEADELGTTEDEDDPTSPGQAAALTDEDEGDDPETLAEEETFGDEPEALSAPSGIRHVDAEIFALDSSYAAWSATAIDKPEQARKKLALRVIRGSDARTERQVLVTVALKNVGEAPLHVFLRRELLNFEVMGPDGLRTCAPSNELRDPERQAFSRLWPGREITLTSRLVELCPRGTFSRAGFYLVRASLNAAYDGSRFDLGAFTGRVYSRQGKPVRVRTNEEPFVVSMPMRFRPAGTAAPPVPPAPAVPGAPSAPAVPVPPPPPPPVMPAPVPEG